MSALPSLTGCLLLLLVHGSAWADRKIGDAPAVSIVEGDYEGRAQFVIRTLSATWYLDRAAGGFSRLLDRDGHDWISFRKEPLSQFPESAGAGYRGIPNLVFGKDNPDAGAGHLGFDQCESALVASNMIRTASKSGRFVWWWTFSTNAARFHMEKADSPHPWWFLYEGTVGGSWSPKTHYWGTDLGGPRRDTPDIKRQLLEKWRWAYFGDDANPRVLFVAQLLSPGNDPISPNGGFVWIENTHTLLWTWYHGYKTGDAPPVLGATRLGEDGSMTSLGPWRVSVPGGLYKSYWGGVIALPPAFAAHYTGGQTLALGFGGYYSICAAASRGPALGAISSPDPAQSTVPVTTLLAHPHDSPAPRDGNYFNANCGFWNEQPRDRWHGTWSFDDYCRAGVFIETPSTHGYVAFVRLGTGRLGYDFGTITSAGTAEYWYLYDPCELGETALGQRQPGQVRPASMTHVIYPLGRTVTGACFDPRKHLLYVCTSWAYPEGLESYPIVHAYHLRSPEGE